MRAVPPDSSAQEQELFDLLERCEIPYQKIKHAAVFTCAQSEGLNLKIPGAHTKQLLLCDNTNKHFVLAIVMHYKMLDMRALGKQLNLKDLTFASPKHLQRLLHVTPGSVTPFGLIFDTECKVQLIVDEDAWTIGMFRFHPLINTATLCIDRSGFERFCTHVNHTFTVCALPVKQRPSPS